MRLNPRYWYVDEKGVTKKYIYCRLCLAGPFKLTDIQEKFFYYGSDEAYCKDCSITHKNFSKFVPESFFKVVDNSPLQPLKKNKKKKKKT
jgi:hypothetical protein